MKKAILYLIAAMVVSTGCRKTFNDSIGNQTADERISAALAVYQKKLSGAPYGWIFVESTTGTALNQGASQTGPKIVLGYYMQFNDSNQVTMLSDFDSSMTTRPRTSGYRLKALQRPTLIFDTYSYLHVPCSPDVAISKSPFGVGFGWGTDFEYSFTDNIDAASLGDTIRLTGNLNGAGGLLIKATKEQQTAYLGGQLKTYLTGLNKILSYFNRLTIDGVIYEIRRDAPNKAITFSWAGSAGKIESSTVNYYSTSTGVVFSSPIVNGSQTIKGFDELLWEPARGGLIVTINGNDAVLAGINEPLKVDTAAPAKWYNTAVTSGPLWESTQGFHINGVDDSLGIRNVLYPSGKYVTLSYFVNFFNNPADAIVVIVRNPLGKLAANAYKSAADAPTFTADGKIVFNELGNVGTVPRRGPVDRTNGLMYSPGGFYLIQTGPESYDMVLATNAKIWISWTLGH